MAINSTFSQIQKYKISHLPEVVQVANTPFPIRLDTHYLMQTHNVWSMPRAEGPSSMFGAVKAVVSIMIISNSGLGTNALWRKLARSSSLKKPFSWRFMLCMKLWLENGYNSL